MGHQGERDLRRHSESAQHKKFVEVLKNTPRLTFGPNPEALQLKDKVHKKFDYLSSIFLSGIL